MEFSAPPLRTLRPAVTVSDRRIQRSDAEIAETAPRKTLPYVSGEGQEDGIISARNHADSQMAPRPDPEVAVSPTKNRLG